MSEPADPRRANKDLRVWGSGNLVARSPVAADLLWARRPGDGL